MAVVTSVASTVAAVTVTASGWWLKDPVDATANAAVNVVGTPTKKREEQATAFYPLGSPYPVVVADAMTGADGTVEVLTLTAAAYAALLVLLTRQRTLLLQSPFGEQWYVRLYGARESALSASTAAAPYRRHKLPYLEVAIP